ncbi:MAG: transposase [Burkholderiales bacterium]|nr:transposase [Burkholderiales bacterium]
MLYFQRTAPLVPAQHFRAATHRRSGGRPKEAWVLEEVLRLYILIDSHGKACAEFNRLFAHLGVTVCKTTVHTWVQKYLTEMEVVRSQTRNRFPELTPANLCWCLDGTGKVDTLGVNHFIFGILDHGSRKILTLKRLVRANAATTLAEVRNAVALFGKPSMIRTDNASIFHSRVFQAGIAKLGIHHEFIPPGKPWKNRIERFFWTLKQKLNCIVPIDGIALDKLLADFTFWYNAVRPHQHLHGFTPLEVWRGIDPYRTAPKEVIPFSAWDGMLTGYYQRR